MARAEGKEEDQDGDKVPESLPTKTPRARYIEHTAAKWAEDATPRGQVRRNLPTLTLTHPLTHVFLTAHCHPSAHYNTVQSHRRSTSPGHAQS